MKLLKGSFFQNTLHKKTYRSFVQMVKYFINSIEGMCKFGSYLKLNKNN